MSAARRTKAKAAKKKVPVERPARRAPEKRGPEVRGKKGPAHPEVRGESGPEVRGKKTVRAAPKLPQTASSKTEAAMAARLDTLEPGSRRYEVLATAIEFKRSWIELAKHLTAAQRDGAFKEWGYRTFEAYAQHELHLRRETAQKLVRSFDFLAAHEKPLLEAAEHGGEAGPLPSYQALDILAEARQNPYLSEQDYRQIRDQVFNEDPPPNQLRKLVKERAPEPPKQIKEDPAERLRKCLALAERLYGMLLEEEVPDHISASVEQAVGGLRRLLED